MKRIIRIENPENLPISVIFEVPKNDCLECEQSQSTIHMGELECSLFHQILKRHTPEDPKDGYSWPYPCQACIDADITKK